MNEHELYDGQILLTSDMVRSHRYAVQSKLPDGSWGEPRDVYGVTTVLKILDKPALVPWAAKLSADEFYRLAAAAETLDKKKLKEIAEKAKAAPYTAKDAGANTGTVVHGAIENYLKNGVFDPTGLEEKAAKSIMAFIQWWVDHKFKPDLIEAPIYSIAGNYAGTLDLTFTTPEGKRILGDIKTTNVSKWAPDGVYPENFAQLGGYAKALFEMDGSRFDDGVIINAGKDGKLRTVWLSHMGVTLDDAIRYWERVYACWYSSWDWKKKMQV